MSFSLEMRWEFCIIPVNPALSKGKPDLSRFKSKPKQLSFVGLGFLLFGKAWLSSWNSYLGSWNPLSSLKVKWLSRNSSERWQLLLQTAVPSSSGIVESVPAHGRGWDWMVFKISSHPNHSRIPWWPSHPHCLIPPFLKFFLLSFSFPCRSWLLQ